MASKIVCFLVKRFCFFCLAWLGGGADRARGRAGSLGDAGGKGLWRSPLSAFPFESFIIRICDWKSNVIFGRVESQMGRGQFLWEVTVCAQFLAAVFRVLSRLLNLLHQHPLPEHCHLALGGEIIVQGMLAADFVCEIYFLYAVRGGA